jgi:hypothetical protein
VSIVVHIAFELETEDRVLSWISVGERWPSAGGDERSTTAKKRDFAAPLHGFVIRG